MYAWLNLKTIKFYLIKSATDFWGQPSYLVVERASLSNYGITINFEIPL